MELGLTLPFSGSLAGSSPLAEAARLGERLGYSTVWVADHAVTPVRPTGRYPYSPDGNIDWHPELPWLDPLVVLAYVANCTQTIQLGTNVLVVPMRPILLVAKQLASIDVLSEGRVLLGAGVGWSQDEFQLLGQPFTERGRRLSEAIDLLRQCWLGGRVRHTGEFFDFAEFGFAPSAARPGGIPIVLGGVSDAALRRTAAKGDGWLPINLTPEQLKGRLQNLERLIAEAGREVRDVRIYAQPGSAGPITPDLARDYAAAGVDHLIVEIDWRHEPYDACLKRIRTIAEEFGLQTPHRDGLP